MALPPEKRQRADEIAALLNENALGKRLLAPAEHAALRTELFELLASDAPVTREADEGTPAIVARANALHKALHQYQWESGDRRALAEKFHETLQGMPDGAWAPPTMTGALGKRPFAMLRAGLPDRLRDNSLAGDAQEAAADLDAALSGLGPAPGAGV